MAIRPIDNYYMLTYNEYVNEMTISDDDIQSSRTFISNYEEIKINLYNLRNEIDELRNIVTNEDCIMLFPGVINNNKQIFTIKITVRAKTIIDKFIEVYLDDSVPFILRSKYQKMIYPENQIVNFDVEVQIENKNFNRIHIPVGIPSILQGMGFGKQIYRKIIKKIGYLSTNRFDRTLDSIAVWNSLRKDIDIYSFIRNDQMVCFDDEVELEDIENVLLKFFEHEIGEKKKCHELDTYALDTDFRNRYNYDIKSNLKFLLK